jgi:hypothetical protein
MSDEDNGSEQETMFTCKKCPNQFFRHDEKEAHREFHRLKRSSNKPRPGPASKTKTNRKGERSSTRRPPARSPP